MNAFTVTVFCIEIPEANSADPDQMPHFAASELGLLCLHMSPKWVYVPKMGIRSNKTCQRDRIACLTAPCSSHKKL